MKAIIIAKPNEKYVWKGTFEKCIIQAVILEDGHISFLEYFNGRVNTLSESFVESLFPIEISLNDRPFLIKENEVFYTILNRKKAKYREKYKLILEKIQTRKIVRRNI
jgi:hypothetical protein